MSRCLYNSSFEKFITNDENSIFYTLNIGTTSTGTKRENYSYIFGKNVIFGCSLCDSIIWPYNEEKNYDGQIV